MKNDATQISSGWMFLNEQIQKLIRVPQSQVEAIAQKRLRWIAGLVMIVAVCLFCVWRKSADGVPPPTPSANPEASQSVSGGGLNALNVTASPISGSGNVSRVEN